MKLQGNNIIVTGASRGFGKYLVGRLWDEGASLLCISRTSLAFDLPIRSDQRCSHFSLDLETIGKREWIPFLNEIDRTPYHGLVNNAAIQGHVGHAWDVLTRELKSVIDVNLIAPIQLCRAIVPEMLKYGHGKIVNLSGGGAANPRPNYSAYATAKAGLVRFSETLAEELRGTGIDVNCVAPGKMPTGMLTPGETAMEQTMSDAADLVIFLLSEESNGITGKLISAVWDNWRDLPALKDDLTASELYTLRRVTEVKAKA